MPLMVAEEVPRGTLPSAGHGAEPDMSLGKEGTGQSTADEIIGTRTTAEHKRQVDGTYRGPGTPPPCDNINRVVPSPDAPDVHLPADEEPWHALPGMEQSRPAATSIYPFQDSHMTPNGLPLSPTSPASSGEEASPGEVVSGDQGRGGAHTNDRHTPEVLDGPNLPALEIKQGLLSDAVCNGGQPGTSPSNESPGKDVLLPFQDGAYAGQPQGVGDADDDDFGTFADTEQVPEPQVDANAVHMPLMSHAADVARGSEAECTEQSAFPDLPGSAAAEDRHSQGDPGASRPASTTEQERLRTTEQGHVGEAEGERPEDSTGIPIPSEVGDLCEPVPLSSPGVGEFLGKQEGTGKVQRAGGDQLRPDSGDPPTESSQGPVPSEGVLAAAGGVTPLPGATMDDASRSQGGQLNGIASGTDEPQERLRDESHKSAERLEDLSSPLETSKHAAAGDQGSGTSPEAAEAAGTPEQAIALPDTDPDDDFADFTASEEPLAGAPLPPDEDADSSDGFGGFEEAVEGASAFPQPRCEPPASTPSLTPAAACPVPSSSPSAPAGSVLSAFDLLNLEDGELQSAIVKLVAPLVDEAIVESGEPCLDGVRARLESPVEASVLSAMPEVKPLAIAWSGTDAERGFLKRVGLSEAAEAAMLQEQNKHELKKQRSRNGTGRGRPQQASAMKRTGSAASRGTNSGELQGSGELHRSGELGGSKELRFSGELRDTVGLPPSGNSSLRSSASFAKSPGPATMGPLGYPTRSIDRGPSLNRLSSIASSVSSRGSQSLGHIPSVDSPKVATDVRLPRSVSDGPSEGAGVPFAMWAMEQMRPQKRRGMSFDGGPATVPATPLSEFGSFSGFRMSRESSREDLSGLRSLSSRGFSNGSAWGWDSSDIPSGTAQGYAESSASREGHPSAGSKGQTAGGPPGVMEGNAPQPMEGPLDPFAGVFPTTGVVLMTAITDDYGDEDFEDFCEAVPDEEQGGSVRGGPRDVGKTSQAALGSSAAAAVGEGLSGPGIAIPDLSWMFATKVQGPARGSRGA